VYNILVVDDSAVDSKVVAHALQRAGYSVTAITQAGDALETLETGDFAVVLLDVNMPSIDGFELLQEIKRRPHFRDLVIIMMSSDAGERRIVRCVQALASPNVTLAVHRGCRSRQLRFKRGARTRGSLAPVVLALRWLALVCVLECHWLSLLLSIVLGLAPCRSIELGAADFILKPMSHAVIQSRVASSLFNRKKRGASSRFTPSSSSSAAVTAPETIHLLKVLVVDDSPTVLKFLG